jgi:hypothetical protein
MARHRARRVRSKPERGRRRRHARHRRCKRRLRPHGGRPDEVVANAVASGALPCQCAATVRRCAMKSTCGRPGRVTCCRATSSGETRCGISKSAEACVAKGGCAGGPASCCDACTGSGCATTTSSTTTTTTQPAICGNGITEAPEECDGQSYCDASCLVIHYSLCCEYGGSICGQANIPPPDLNERISDCVVSGGTPYTNSACVPGGPCPIPGVNCLSGSCCP